MEQVDNPYDKNKQEALYLAYEHGLNSTTEDDNPYSEMPEMSNANSAWMKGFRANKKKAKVVKPSPLTPEETMPVESTEKEVTTVQTLPDDLLLAEIKRRKKEEYNKLIKEKNALLMNLEVIQERLAKLETLFQL